MIALLALGVLAKLNYAPYANAWAEVSRRISSTFYARGVRSLEMQRLLAKYKPIAESANSNEAFQTAVEAMTAEFGDSHFDLYTSDDQGFYMMNGISGDEPLKMPQFGAWFKKGLSGYRISMVLDGGAAAKADLHKGDVIQTVDGQPFSPVRALRNKVGRTVQLGVMRGDRTMIATVAITSSTALEMFLQATKDSVRVITVGGRKIGYCHVWTLTTDAFKRALSDAVYGQLAATTGMILDLRDGFGGMPFDFADPFFRPQINIAFGLSMSGNSRIFGYQQPLELLINEGTRSAAEMLSYILKKSKRAELVGANTAGNVLAATAYHVTDWAYLEIPISGVLVDGLALEHVGVAPDITVTPQYDEAGKDLVLAQALERLTRRAAAP